MGYSEMLLAEPFCNGTPLSETADGTYTYTAPLTNQQVAECVSAIFVG